MKNSIYIKGITVFLLFSLTVTSSAGCLCADSDCCFLSLQNEVSSSMQDSGSNDCDCGCTSDRCSTTMQNSTVHQHHTIIQSVLQLLGQQTLVAAFYSQLALNESVSPIPVFVTLFSSPSNSFLYSSKTSSLLI